MMDLARPHPPARPGTRLDEIDTPALIVDLDAFERNLRRMAVAAARHGVRLRPHAKTHKSPVIARIQAGMGAVGVCCQKVSEAEIMVAGGVENVLVSNEVIGPAKLDRLAVLARQAEIRLCVDHAVGVEQAAAAAARAGVVLQILVEIDVGAARCGVAPGPLAVELAAQVARHDSLKFVGLQAYHGAAQHFRGHDERRAAIETVISETRRTVELLARDGLVCEEITGAGTGTFEFEAGSGLYTEIQPGSYIFMDADYARNRNASGERFDSFEHALFVLTTVMSRPASDRAIVDAGHKAASLDSGPPLVHRRPGITYERPSDEHGVLIGDAASLPGIGERIRLVPGHCDPTVNLHDWYVCVRGLGDESTDTARVEAVWPVAARGALF